MTESPRPYVPTDEARKLHGDFIAEANKRELASTDNFDKSVLTLSSAGLGLSLSFLKDMGGQAVSLPWVLYLSWCMFIVATVSTMSSFMVSIKALERHKDLAHRAYILGDDSAFDGFNPWNRFVQHLNALSAGSFFLALALTIVFVISNVEGKRMTASSNKPSTSQRTTAQNGVFVPTMQRPSAPTSASTPAPAPSPAPPSAPSNGSSKG